MELDDVGLDSTDRALRDTVRRVVAEQVAPNATETDRTGAFPAASFAALAGLGLVGLAIPEEYGGGGATVLQYVLTIEEIARGCAATAAVVMTQTHAAMPILLAGTASQKEQWLPRLARGQIIGALALTEPEAGSDLASLRTRAVASPNGWSLRGTKLFITNGGRAGVVCVMARASERAGSGGLSMFLVPTDRAGFTAGQPLKKMGIRGSETVELTFDDVELETDALIGTEGEGWRIAMTTLQRARLSTAAQAVGIAEAAYQRALTYARERRQFGRPLLDFQAVSFRIADMAIQIGAARAFLYRVAIACDAEPGGSRGEHTAMAKVFCSDTAARVAADAVQTLGGYGYMEEFGVERLMRDAKITQIYDGTNDINRLVVGRALKATQ